MANPITINCPQNAWTRVAKSVQNICLWKSDKSPASYLYTYRITGDSAPYSRLEGQPLFIDNYFERIQSAYSLDVYIFAVGDNGQIRVDEFLFYPKIDDGSKSAIFIDYNHHEIHDGVHYFHSDVITTNIVITSAKLLRNNRLGAGGNLSSRVAGSACRGMKTEFKCDR